MREKPILRITAKLLIPPMLLFALYVQFHGDFGPGGGFQAGVIFAAAIVLYALMYGVDKARQVIPAWVTRFFLAFGVLLYAGTGVVTMLLGGNFLDYNYLAHDPLHGQHWGIFTVELGVGITVAAAMITIFLTYAGQVQDDHPDEEDEV